MERTVINETLSIRSASGAADKQQLEHCVLLFRDYETSLRMDMFTHASRDL